MLQEFEEQKIKSWEQGVEAHTEDNLYKNLLIHEADGNSAYLVVNFDKKLVELLREVKYLRLLNYQVPEKAQKLYDRVDVYRAQTGNLEFIVGMYNNIQTTMLSVEKPLLRDKIKLIDRILKPGIETLKWKDEKINPFIKEAMLIVTDINELVK